MHFINAAMMLIMLLNPFFVILYLMNIVKKQDLATFARTLIRAGLCSILVFSCFGVLGDIIFRDIFKANFASFQIFGGIVFLLIGIQFVLKGTTAIDALRGDSANVSGAIAMPILIGPGTISASMLIGKQLAMGYAVLTIAVTVSISMAIIILLKSVHDAIQEKREALIERYIEVAGRILALYIGTISIDMIMRGMTEWIHIIASTPQ